MAGTRRRRVAHRHVGISEKALEAWRAGDKHGCHQALGVAPWDFSPFDVYGPRRPNTCSRTLAKMLSRTPRTGCARGRCGRR